MKCFLQIIQLNLAFHSLFLHRVKLQSGKNLYTLVTFIQPQLQFSVQFKGKINALQSSEISVRTHRETMITHDISILLHPNLTVDNELELIFCVSLFLLHCMWCCLPIFVCKAHPLYLIALNCNIMVKNKHLWGDFLRRWLRSDV